MKQKVSTGMFPNLGKEESLARGGIFLGIEMRFIKSTRGRRDRGREFSTVPWNVEDLLGVRERD